jgi:hypothetical protein
VLEVGGAVRELELTELVLQVQLVADEAVVMLLRNSDASALVRTWLASSARKALPTVS